MNEGKPQILQKYTNICNIKPKVQNRLKYNFIERNFSSCTITKN